MMKAFLTTIIALCFSASTAQQLKYKATEVDSIDITSTIGAYQFDEKGTFETTSQTLLISYNKQLNAYLTEKCFTYHSVYESETETTKERTKYKKNETGKKVDSVLFNELLIALSDEDSADLDYIDSTQWRLLVTDKRIRSYAKKRDLDWQFKRRYSTTDENDVFFESCKSYDTLKLYLRKRFIMEPYGILFDYYNSVFIEIYTKNKIYNFEGTFTNHLRQPWYDHSDSTVDLWDIDGIVNLNINKVLEKLLPEGFLLKNSISREALVDDYLTWFFERRDMD